MKHCQKGTKDPGVDYFNQFCRFGLVKYVWFGRFSLVGLVW